MQTDETRARAETVLRKFGDGLSWQRGRGNDTWDAAIRAMIAFAAPPAVERDRLRGKFGETIEMGLDMPAGSPAVCATVERLLALFPTLHPSDREAIARIIDPMAWGVHEKQMRYVAQISDPEAKRWRQDIADSAVESSLAKADAIMALSGSLAPGNAPE